MPILTPKLGIKKPLGNESVNRQTQNENLDIIDAATQKEIHKGAAAPTTPADNDLWLDTSVTPNVLKRYNAAGANWVDAHYQHPVTHPATIIAQDADNRFVTDTEKVAWNAKETPSGVQAKIDAAIAALINGAPGALDTLIELSNALGSDPNFATTVTNSIAAAQAAINAHEADVTNPHGVTVAQIGASNAIYTGSPAVDPNTTQTAYMLTNHANSPNSGGVYWHIRTFFYSTLTGNRAQMAIRYNGTIDEMYFRSYFSTTWTTWKRVWHAGNLNLLGGNQAVVEHSALLSQTDTRSINVTRDVDGKVSTLALKDGATTVSSVSYTRNATTGLIETIIETVNGKTITTTINRDVDGKFLSTTKTVV